MIFCVIIKARKLFFAEDCAYLVARPQDYGIALFPQSF